MARLPILFISFLLALATFHGVHAVTFTVANEAATTPGGMKFNNNIGVDSARQTMSDSTDFIWRLFQQNTESDRKNVQQVSLFVRDVDGVAATSNDQIVVSARYLDSFQGDISREFSGVVYHEMTHVWQWDGSTGSSRAPSWVIEGVADYVRLRANYIGNGWAQPGQGGNWTDSYSVTARFFEYCNSLKNGFVAELNSGIRNGYSDNLFNQILGKPVDQLWRDYKAQYGQK